MKNFGFFIFILLFVAQVSRGEDEGATDTCSCSITTEKIEVSECDKNDQNNEETKSNESSKEGAKGEENNELKQEGDLPRGDTTNESLAEEGKEHEENNEKESTDQDENKNEENENKNEENENKGDENENKGDENEKESPVDEKNEEVDRTVLTNPDNSTLTDTANETQIASSKAPALLSCQKLKTPTRAPNLWQRRLASRVPPGLERLGSKYNYRFHSHECNYKLRQTPNRNLLMYNCRLNYSVPGVPNVPSWRQSQPVLPPGLLSEHMKENIQTPPPAPIRITLRPWSSANLPPTPGRLIRPYVPIADDYAPGRIPIGINHYRKLPGGVNTFGGNRCSSRQYDHFNNAIDGMRKPWVRPGIVRPSNPPGSETNEIEIPVPTEAPKNNSAEEELNNEIDDSTHDHYKPGGYIRLPTHSPSEEKNEAEESSSRRPSWGDTIRQVVQKVTDTINSTINGENEVHKSNEETNHETTTKSFIQRLRFWKK